MNEGEKSELKELKKTVEKLEYQLEMIRLDMELINRKNCQDIRKNQCSINAHRTMLMDLKPVYDEYRIKKIEQKMGTERAYG